MARYRDKSVGDPASRAGAPARMPGDPLARQKSRGGVLMLPCKDATQLISQSMDTPLPIVKRIRLRLHIRICEWCARYERQLLLIRKTLRRLDAAGDRPEGRAGGTPSEDARGRLKKHPRNPQ